MVSRIIFFIALFAASMFGPAPYGRVRGRVTEAAVVVPGAAIRVTSMAANVVTNAARGSAGNYEDRNLFPGQYKLLIEMRGFKTYERGPIQVRVGDVVTVDVALEVGAVSDSVPVMAQAPLLEPANARVSQVIDSRRVCAWAGHQYGVGRAPGRDTQRPVNPVRLTT